MEIYILRESQERGPYDPESIDKMLEEGSIRLTDPAWCEGLPEWTTLDQVLGSEPEISPARQTAEHPPAPAPAQAVEEKSPEAATAKQKAFLSYMGIAFPPGVTKAKAALLVNEAMENPKDASRLARWSEDRLRLHPELFAADVLARKENRPNFFFERVQKEGAECFQNVSKAHCQVLVGYLDVKHPNWDARDSDAAWDYFFPAIAEKFPQLVTKAWRGRLKYADGPRIAVELKRTAPTSQSVRRTAPFFTLKKAALFLLLAGLAGGGYYTSKHLRRDGAVTGTAGMREPTIVFQSAPAATPAPATAGKTETTPAAAETPAPEKPVTANPPPAAEPGPAMSDPAMAAKPAGEMAASPMATAPMAATPAPDAPPAAMAATPPADTPAPGPAPALFTPPAAATSPTPVAPTAATVPATARTSVKLTRALTVQLAYGRITVAPGTALKIVEQNSTAVKVSYMNSVISVPLSFTDLAP